MQNKTILSGTTATGQLHLGNYIGALKPWVEMVGAADEGTNHFFFVADLHGITVPHDPRELKNITREIAAAYIASGLDTSKIALFPQSALPEHSELMWLLACQTQIGKLNRMTQFKEKTGKNAEKAGLGLYAYPVLMVADILLYKATHVPVGEDQKQHLELTRDVASTFNHKFGETFPLPDPIIRTEGARIMSLRDGTKKMSKSAESDMSKINLTDDADTIAQKFKKAKSDPDLLPGSEKETENRPEAKNLLTIYSVLSDTPMENTYNQFAGKQFSELKSALSDLAVEKLAPITAEMNRLMQHPDEIDTILRNGAERARATAHPVLRDVQDKMGFLKV